MIVDDARLEILLQSSGLMDTIRKAMQKAGKRVEADNIKTLYKDSNIQITRNDRDPSIAPGPKEKKLLKKYKPVTSERINHILGEARDWLLSQKIDEMVDNSSGNSSLMLQLTKLIEQMSETPPKRKEKIQTLLEDFPEEFDEAAIVLDMAGEKEAAKSLRKLFSDCQIQYTGGRETLTSPLPSAKKDITNFEDVTAQRLSAVFTDTYARLIRVCDGPGADLPKRWLDVMEQVGMQSPPHTQSPS